VKWEATRRKHRTKHGRYIKTKITGKRQMGVYNANSARRKTPSRKVFIRLFSDK
jgi:hypothetical protein